MGKLEDPSGCGDNAFNQGHAVAAHAAADERDRMLNFLDNLDDQLSRAATEVFIARQGIQAMKAMLNAD